MDVTSRSVLVLNGSMQIIGKVSVERAICLIYLGKAHSIKNTDMKLRSAHMEIDVPELISVPNAKYIRMGKTTFTKRAMLERDNYTCVYCGNQTKSLLTKDHIIPRNRWTEISKKLNVPYKLDSFENCVTACLDCNQSKSNKLLSEMGWKDVKGKKPLETVEIDWSTIL